MRLNKPKRVKIGVEDWGSFLIIKIPPFQVWVHLHVRPNEKTDKGAFTITTAVTVHVKTFGRQIFERKGLLQSEETWGLCARLGKPFDKEAIS